MIKQLSKAVVSGESIKARKLIKKLLEENVPLETIISEGVVSGMEIVSEKFQSCEFSVVNVIAAGDTVKTVLKFIKKYCPEEQQVNKIGKAIIGTVQGDVHSIGKNLVALTMQSNGIEVIDLGVDVSPQQFVKAVFKYKPDFVCMSCLLSVTMFKMKDTVLNLKEVGLREHVKIMVGGTSVTQNFADEIGADFYLENGFEVGKKARELLLDIKENRQVKNTFNSWVDLLGVGYLKEIQESFYSLTGLGITFTDLNYQPVLKSKEYNKDCNCCRGRELIENDLESKKERLKQYCLKYDNCKVQLGICRASLLEIQYPIRFSDIDIGHIICDYVLLGGNNDCKDNNIRCINAEQLDLIIKLLKMISENISSKNRIQFLEKHLNELNEKLLEYMDIQEDLRVDLHEATLNKLQSQSNPHFLFNSLNTIARLAHIEDAGKTEELSYALAGILRYSLKNVKKTVTIQEEINIIKDYLFIQQVRFSDRLKFHYDIDENTLDAVIPCMMLQPLVENAIVHGLEPIARKVLIKILLKKQGNGITFTVEDNGKGIPEKRLQEITRFNISGSGKGHSTGLGLINVHQRLHLFYDSGCGLQIESRENQGTRASIYFPYIHKGAVENV